MGLVKGEIMRMAKKIRRGSSASTVLTISFPNEFDDNYVLRGRLSPVQNTLNFRIFGAILWLENYYIRTSYESAIVNILIVIPQLYGRAAIGESVVKVNSVSIYKGPDRDAFVAALPSLVVAEWNR